MVIKHTAIYNHIPFSKFSKVSHIHLPNK